MNQQKEEDSQNNNRLSGPFAEGGVVERNYCKNVDPAISFPLDVDKDDSLMKPSPSNLNGTTNEIPTIEQSSSTTIVEETTNNNNKTNLSTRNMASKNGTHKSINAASNTTLYDGNADIPKSYKFI